MHLSSQTCKLFQSNLLRSRFLSTMVDQIAMMVNEHNGIAEELSLLQDSEGQLRYLDGLVASTSAEVNRRQGLKTKTQQDDACMQKRIHRNENPRFLHYLVCHREAKVQRLKGEKQELEKLHQDLTLKLSTDSAQLTNLQQQWQSQRGVVERKHQLERRSTDLFDQVADAQPPTQELHQLRAGVQLNRGLEASDQALLQAVGNTAQQVRQGLSLFQQASTLYQEARSVNEQAKNVVRREQYQERRERRDIAHGDYCDAENAELQRQRLDRQERDLQCRRDNLINQAHDVAMQAYQIISNAFATFPAEARGRYPQLCASFGQVAFPRVQGACFAQTLMTDAIFGTWGAAMNDMSSGCQIQDNLRIVERCASMTSQQLDMVAAIQSALTTGMQQLRASISHLEQNIQIERNNIFNNVRAAVMSQ